MYWLCSICRFSKLYERTRYFKIIEHFLTAEEGSSYWILRRSIARIMLCMAIKMFWKTNLMKPRLSSSEYPAPWIILICFINVDFPDSPVPEMFQKYTINIQVMIETLWLISFYKYNSQTKNYLQWSSIHIKLWFDIKRVYDGKKGNIDESKM